MTAKATVMRPREKHTPGLSCTVFEYVVQDYEPLYNMLQDIRVCQFGKVVLVFNSSTTPINRVNQEVIHECHDPLNVSHERDACHNIPGRKSHPPPEYTGTQLMLFLIIGLLITKAILLFT